MSRPGIVRGALGLLLLACATAAEGQTAATRSGSHLTVYVMTMGPGQQVWERFGHNAIWIHDPVAGTDQAYNYGLFDFAEEDFLTRFIQGQMRYWMAGFPAARYVESYRRDNRSVWIQELALPPEARVELQRFLEWNALPENRFYRYDYYRDNCSTRVRDALDRVLGGRIQSQVGARPTGTTYRSHTQRLTANDPPIFTGLLLALGEGVDRPISAWEEMFLPLKLREHLRDVTVENAAGERVPLVAAERTLFTSTAPPPPEHPPDWLPWYLLIGTAIGGGAVALGVAAKRSSGARLGLGAVVGGWALAAGVAGNVLAGLWLFTDHVMAYQNENLLQMNPLALALAVLGPVSLGSRRRLARAARGLAVGLAGLAVLGMVLQVLPGFDQVNGPIIALALPAHIGVALSLRRAM